MKRDESKTEPICVMKLNHFYLLDLTSISSIFVDGLTQSKYHRKDHQFQRGEKSWSDFMPIKNALLLFKHIFLQSSTAISLSTCG